MLADRRALLASRLMAPTYRMPHPLGLRAEATVAEITDALHAARCAAELAGVETEEFVVRELLLAVVQQIDRATSAVRLLPATASRRDIV